MTTNRSPQTTGKSLMEKLRTLTNKTTSKISDAIEPPATASTSDTMSHPSIFKSLYGNGTDTVTSTGDGNVPEERKGMLNILRYIVIIAIIVFVILNILAVMGYLPTYLAELFNPLLFLKYNSEKSSSSTEKESKLPKVPKSQKVPKATEKKEPKEPKLATSIEKEPTEDDNKISSLKELENIAKKINKINPITSDTADSKIQLSKTRQKSGYCYIGEDRGFRSCIKVNEKDMCESGDIFPTKDICINPKLRA